MRYLVALVVAVIAQTAWSQAWEDRQVFNPAGQAATLRIVSSTDTGLFAPLVEAFVARNPGVAVEYLVTGTADLDRRFRQTPEAFDIAISSAMDLQLKLTNDGYALELDGVSHPDWAVWRKSLFAFTAEPAAIVVNRSAFKDLPKPTSRQELIETLRARPNVFRGRVGTYDVRQSGLGYLFATQDARTSETFWRLMEVMGGLDARLYCCSNEMLDDLIDGTLYVAYNVLGSYSEVRVESAKVLEVILPSNFPTTMMRTVLVSSATEIPEVAERFVRFLVAHQSDLNEGRGALPPLVVGDTSVERATIALGPSLLTFLDALKRKKFISEWESALIQN